MSEETRRASRRLARRSRRWPIVGIALAVLAVPLLLGASVYTDGSEFCTSCHEMQPYHEAWTSGPHVNEAECIECHVDVGLAGRLLHKPTALGEVVAHLRGDTSFPREEAPEIPDERCLACHEDVAEGEGGFSHTEHAERATCAMCHFTTGHEVTRQSLAEAGVLDEATWDARFESGLASDVVAAPGAGVANVDGHVEVACTDCHDLARTGCEACHETPETQAHAPEPDCLVCHEPVGEWQFLHPEVEECLDCHAAPETEAHQVDLACVTCHSIKTWEFDHPTSGDCLPCHARPADVPDHPERNDCGACHSTTGGWAHDK
jgi:nitrate/TMAO reductase-like tetraheme cytochrome c subunit